MWMAPKTRGPAQSTRHRLSRFGRGGPGNQLTPVRRSVWLRRDGERKGERKTMSREVETQSGAKAAADNTNPNPDPGTPAVVDYEAHAAQLRTMLEAVPQEVPHWLWFHPATAKDLRGGRLVPEVIITSV